MEVDDDTSSVINSLDAVSTCLNEVQDLIDPEFKRKVQDFFTTKPSSTITAKDLPIFAKKSRILQDIRRYRVTIVEGTTGCGKTTQVPQFIIDDCFARDENFNVVVTQPRRIAAKSIAERVAFERGWTIGDLVGYQIGMDRTASENTRLLYCTTGVLLQKLITAKKFDNYTHIIIDEVHERDDETDLLLMVVKKFLWQHTSKVKVILMSATFDVDKFKQYFSLRIGQQVMSPASISIVQKTYDIILSYLEDLRELYSGRLGVKINDKFNMEDPYLDPDIMKIVPELLLRFEKIERQSNKKRGTVLIFLPGYDTIVELKKLLEQTMPVDRVWRIYPLHSSITLEEQSKIFDKTIVNERKVILATNIAESSITVPNCEYVIDFCLTKNLVLDPETNYPTLKLEWAAQANCTQRAGRTGRTQAGRVFRLVPKQFYESFPHASLPELLRTPLENSVLKVKRLEMGSPKELLGSCIDKPSIIDLKKAILRLKRVGALNVTKGDVYDPEDGDLTFLGELMAQLPLDVQIARFVVLGHVFDVLDDCIIIAACLSMQNFFTSAFDKKLESYKAKLAWADNTWSDPIALYNAYQLYQRFLDANIFRKDSDKAMSWCARNFIQYKRLKDVVVLVEELRKRVDNLNLRNEPRPNQEIDPIKNELILKVVIAGGFYPYYYEKVPLDPSIDYAKEINGKDYCSTIRLDNFPKDHGVVYANQLKEKLKPVSNNFELEFENTKAYVTFTGNDDPLKEAINNQVDTLGDRIVVSSHLPENNRKDMPLVDRQVKTEVYVAVKMGKISDRPIMLEKYPQHYIDQYLPMMKRIRDEKVERNRYLRRDKFKVILGDEFSEIIIPDVRMPSFSQKTVNLYVTEVIDPVNFWAQYSDALTKHNIMDLNEAIDNVQFQGNYSNPTKGDYLLADYSTDGGRTFFRAKVTRVDRPRRKFTLFFIDYGTEKVIDFDENYTCMKMHDRLPPVLFSIPALAIRCRLPGCKPADILNYHSDVIEEAKNYFKSLVNHNQNLIGNVYAVVEKVLLVNLYEENSSLSIADHLITKNYVQAIEESPSAKKDHSLRRSYVGPDEEMSSDALLDKESCYEVAPPKCPGYDDIKRIRGSTTEKIRIRGPFTPIQAKFTGITFQDSKEDVDIDQNSVNSICLDPDPANSTSRLLVAGHVSMSSNSGKVLCRNTTLMPNIKAFGIIMALVFSPKIELRCEGQMDLYTGAICGIGYNEKDKKSYDPDTDMELAFDVIITAEDIKKVNVTRMYLNTLLTDKEEFLMKAGAALKNCQDKAREFIINLLQSKRLTNKVETSRKVRRKWGQLPPELFYDPTKQETKKLQSKPILPYIQFIRSVDGKSWIERISTQLEALKHIIQG